ncbi:hypothetical protein [Hyphomicrobium sp.]|uniref:hypothetical protein n=1 Tax=Hyphomicrobium sp. TaxID=82 RepID=UPI0025B890D1|nr:hypothetical protein [Hyphomicrobium sp.]MCC7251526.1 hypothetical protein [Hyphomicrobium sp.]
MRSRAGSLIFVGLLATAALWPEPASAGGMIGRCAQILKEYVGKPALKGASEALGAYLADLLLNKAVAAPTAPQATPDEAPPPPLPAVPSAEALEPPPELSMDYFYYLQSLGLSECEVRTAMERTFGPPSAKRYNQD